MLKAISRSFIETVELAKTGETHHTIKDPDTETQWKVTTLSHARFVEMGKNNFNIAISKIDQGTNFNINTPFTKKR